MRWVLAHDNDVCSRFFSNSGFTVTLSLVFDFAEANRMVLWDDSSKLLNLFFFETFSSFLFSKFFSRQVVRCWIDPARLLRVTLDRPVIARGLRGFIVEAKMSFFKGLLCKSSIYLFSVRLIWSWRSFHGQRPTKIGQIFFM